MKPKVFLAIAMFNIIYCSFKSTPNATTHSILRSNQLTNSVAQEPEGSSPHSQQPATVPCPELVKSNPPPPSQSPQDPF
jgi:hypothetical protein